MTDRRGTYKRCYTTGCRKKVMDERNFCAYHEALRLEQLMETNKSITQLVEAVVIKQLKLHGVI